MSADARDAGNEALRSAADREREMADKERALAQRQREHASAHDRNEPMHQMAARIHENAAALHERMADMDDDRRRVRNARDTVYCPGCGDAVHVGNTERDVTVRKSQPDDASAIYEIIVRDSIIHSCKGPRTS